jgi:hypothetical protein
LRKIGKNRGLEAVPIKKFNYKIKVKDKKDYQRRKTKYNGEVITRLVEL